MRPGKRKERIVAALKGIHCMISESIGLPTKIYYVGILDEMHFLPKTTEFYLWGHPAWKLKKVAEQEIKNIYL